MGKLNSLSVQRANNPGLTSDGDGLYLQITKSGSKSWIFRYMKDGRARAMGLGPIDLVSLAEARLKAHECRKILIEKSDPLDVRKSELEKLAVDASKTMSFDKCAEKYIESQRSAWKNAKHAQQWENTLKSYVSPIIGHLKVETVDTALIMQIIGPLWITKTETASRIRNRIELVLAWATVRGYRSGSNPAAWRNHLDKLLPKRSRVQKVQHHAAMPFTEVGVFVSKLQRQRGAASRALEFLILTATRTSETLNAEWPEINFDEKIWVIPDQRMKGGVEHRVPLSPRSLEILEEMRSISPGKYIFPGARHGRPLSNMAMLKVLERMNVPVVSHGFRSSFRNWTAERTNFPREVCEQALAHALRDKVEAAYLRSDLLLKRRLLMDQWANYCASSIAHPAPVIDINSSSREA